MTAARYPRNRIASVLLKSGLSDCYRIMSARHAGKPLGTAPADSRFCSRTDAYAVLYASADFATASIETVVRDRFTHRRERRVGAQGLVRCHGSERTREE